MTDSTAGGSNSDLTSPRREGVEPWPLPDVIRARDFMVSALTPRSVLAVRDLELLADLDVEVARRTGSKPQALEQLLFATRHLQTRRERQIGIVRRGRMPHTQTETAAC